MHVQLANTFQQLHDLRGSWNDLARDVPFRTHEWLHGWWRHYGPGQRLFVLAVHDNEGELIGIAPWYIERSAARGRVIKPLGSGEVCSDYLSILCQPTDEDRVAEALADFLCDERSIRWDLFDLGGVDAEDTAIMRLVESMAEREQLVCRRPAHRCWRIALPPTWDDYLAQLSKSHRKQLRRFESRVLDTNHTMLHTVATPEQLDVGWKVLVNLHQRRRASLGQPGCFASPKFASFHHEACYWLLATGRLRMYWLEHQGFPIAAEYQLAGGGDTYCYQAGVDPDELGLEPGRLIMIATLKRAISQGQRSFDLLRGDEPYKQHWRAVPRQTYNYRVVNNRTVSLLRHNLWLATDSMKGWMRGRGMEEAIEHALEEK